MTSLTRLVTPETTSEEQAARFFREMQNELGIPSTQKIVAVVGCILTQLRKSLSHDQASVLIQHLPDTFKLLLISGWRYDDQESSVNHLDQLADRVYMQTARDEHKLFSTEIEALNTVLQVFLKLDKFFGLFACNVLQYTLTEEIRQAAILEDAA
jgi:uncharacterized protein (DUF2267 family)